jgi:hypothetical protein
MRISRKTVLIAASLVVLAGITVVIGGVVAVVKFVPVAKTWTTIALSSRDVSIGEALIQLVGRLNSAELKALMERGVDPATLAAAANKKEFATLLSAVANYPALGAVIRDGTYREAMAEAVRQKAPTISQIQLDRVPTPQAREAVQKVQGLLLEIGPAASKVAAVDAPVLALLQTPEFATLLQDTKFVDFLARPNAGKGIE